MNGIHYQNQFHLLVREHGPGFGSMPAAGRIGGWVAFLSLCVKSTSREFLYAAPFRPEFKPLLHQSESLLGNPLGQEG